MEILIPLLVIFVLILLNGIFVAAEFSIIGVSRTAIERRASSGDAAAMRVRDILHDPLRQDRFIATAQLGITAASLGLGMYGEHALAVWLAAGLENLGLGENVQWITAHSLASILAIAILTYFHIVIGEMVPKSMALMHAEGTALWITRPMLWIKTATYPFVIGLNSIGNAVLRLMGVRRQVTSGHYYSSEELQFIVRESQEGGLLHAELGQVLRDLFEFGELIAREVMVPRVLIKGIPQGASPELLSKIVAKASHTRYPVYEGDLDHIVGVVHIKDILRLLTENRSLTPEYVRAAAFVPETAELDSVLDAMNRTRTQMVIVMDEHGGTAGSISIEDLGDEAIGEVEEGADELPEMIWDPRGHLRVSGTLRLEELGERLEMVLEHEEVDTVSGLILALLERPPVTGDIVEYWGVRFEVSDVEGHGVKRCIVTRVEPPEEQGEPGSSTPEAEA